MMCNCNRTQIEVFIEDLGQKPYEAKTIDFGGDTFAVVVTVSQILRAFSLFIFKFIEYKNVAISVSIKIFIEDGHFKNIRHVVNEFNGESILYNYVFNEQGYIQGHHLHNIEDGFDAMDLYAIEELGLAQCMQLQKRLKPFCYFSYFEWRIIEGEIGSNDTR